MIRKLATALCLTWCTGLLAAVGCNAQRPSTATDVRASSTAATAAETFIKPCPFKDRAQALHVEFTYRSGAEADHATMLESLGGGVGWLDFDRDGWLDLLVTGGGGFTASLEITGRSSALFRNLGGQGFREVTAAAKGELTSLYTNGLSIGDYDNDGFQDFVITGYGAPQLWHNRGDGTFAETAAPAGVTDSKWSSGAGWADLNADGNLDLYLAHYVNWSFDNHPYCGSVRPGVRDICAPRSFAPLPHVVYFSRGDGTFEDVSSQVGLRPDGKGLGVLLFDAEPDGDMDIYVANDTTDNFLYLNDGRGQFAEVGVSHGVACDDRGIPNGSMGIDVCDFNQDGKPDIWVANYEHEAFALYRNEGDAYFLHLSQRLGITDLGGQFVGFGTACEDFDADGDQDFVVANGHVIKYPTAAPRKQLPLLLTYNGRRYERERFAPESYFEQPHEGRGLATADFDRDGDLDIAISHLNVPVALLVNEFHARNRWLSVELIGTQSNRDAIGARVELKTSAGSAVRQVTGGASYLSHSARAVHFALPDQVQPQSLLVRWPAGAEEQIDVSSLAGQVTLVEAATPGTFSRAYSWQKGR